ncbi:MAG: DNA repair protein RecO [Planctomycetota bacterium]|nr:DNA repair protein RecO [Planctomycetota bacterium]MDA1165073.1 DNA repair protein RecO [Planctomycetota bacterium]
MQSEKADAIVIRLADFSNTSRVVTFFTREFGKTTAIAKGGKRLKGPFDSALDLLSTCRIVFLRKSSSALDILTEASLTDRFRPPSDSLNSFYAGCYVAELLGGLTEEYDPHEHLFDASIHALRQFADGNNVHLSLLKFELATLQEIGQLPSFDDCVHCAELIDVEESYTFRVSQGGLVCPRCQHAGSSEHQIQAGTVALLRKLANSSDCFTSRITASPQQLREMRFTLTATVSSILGRRPSSLRYLQF